MVPLASGVARLGHTGARALATGGRAPRGMSSVGTYSQESTMAVTDTVAIQGSSGNYTVTVGPCQSM